MGLGKSAQSFEFKEYILCGKKTFETASMLIFFQ